MYPRLGDVPARLSCNHTRKKHNAKPLMVLMVGIRRHQSPVSEWRPVAPLGSRPRLNASSTNLFEVFLPPGIDAQGHRSQGFHKHSGDGMKYWGTYHGLIAPPPKESKAGRTASLPHGKANCAFIPWSFPRNLRRNGATAKNLHLHMTAPVTMDLDFPKPLSERNGKTQLHRQAEGRNQISLFRLLPLFITMNSTSNTKPYAS